MEETSLSVIGGQDAMDDFPVLKAFQQYVDNEQNKARKRMLTMGVFFGFVLLVVISVFVMLLVNVSQRNQTLNDRLVEYAMKDRERNNAPVVVQPQADSSVVLALTGKLEEMQKQLAAQQAETGRLAREAAEQAAKAEQARAAAAKGPSEAELEVVRLKAQLKAEQERAAIEKEAKRQAELEAYRRKHYPELYERPRKSGKKTSKAEKEADAEIESIINDDDEPVSYFDEDDDEASTPKVKAKSKVKKEKKTAKEEPKSPAAAESKYVIPVEVKKSATSGTLRIPND